MKKLVLVFAAAIIATSAASAAIGYKLAPGPNHLRARALAVKSHLAQAPDVQVVVLGDSIVERADLAAVCKAKTINAGVSGATVADLDTFARQIDPRRAPRIIVAVGINDAKAGARGDIDQVMQRYAGLIDYLQSSGAKVSVASVVSAAASEDEYDPFYVRTFNTSLRQMATARGLDVIDLGRIADADRHLPAGLAVDGVHLNAAGYQKWSEVLAPACA